MKRSVPFVATCLTLAVVMLLTIASAQAGGKDKRSFKMKSNSSSGPSAMNFSPNKSTFSATPKKLNFDTGGNTSGNNQFKNFKKLNSKQLNNSAVGNLSTKNLSNFNQFQSLDRKSLSSHTFDKGLSSREFSKSHNSALLNNTGKNGLKLHGGFANQANLADAVQAGRFKNALQNNLANQKFPKDLADTSRKTIAEQIKNHGLLEGINDPPVIDPGIGNGDPGNDPGNGDPGNGDPGNGDPGNGDPGNGNGPGGDGDHHDHDCHFPWWPPIIIGGGYHDHCYPGGYYGGGYCPPVNNITVVEQPITTVAPAVQPFVDLELLDVRFVDAGDPAKNLGLRYRIVFRNRGTLPVGNFQVLVMASADGTPQPGAPAATAEVIALAAGEVLSVDLRLPVSADVATMNALIVALDSALQVAELDEENNVVVLDRTKIAAADLASIGAP